MTRILPLLTAVYVVLLRLYPREFRDEFGNEMASVFNDTLAEAANHGSVALIFACLRELRDLPSATLREQWLARRNMATQGSWRVSRRELLSTALPFLLCLAIPIVGIIQISWLGMAVLLLLGVLVVLMVMGLIKGMPRWSLPSLGLWLAVLNYVVLSLKNPNFNPVASASPFVRQLYGAGLPWIGIILLTLVVVLATRTIKPWRTFFLRMRQDCTLLPFALYGIMPLVMVLSFDDYQGEEPYQIGMGLILLASLWLYLRLARPWQRLLALGIGITLAMGVEAIGKWILVPSQQWGIWFQWHTIEGARQLEVTSTGFTWFWVMVVIFLPALLGLFPRSMRFPTVTQT